MIPVLLAAKLAFAEPSLVRVKTDRVEQISWSDYLARVVEKEAGPGFPDEALKAQAVVARSYAMSRVLRAKEQAASFDLEAGTLGQALSERPASKRCYQAVRDTEGLVLMAEGRPVEAFFHAACGGATADPKDVFHARSPGISSVTCGYCRNMKNFHWSGGISRKDLAKAAQAQGWPGLQGLKPGEEDGRGRQLSVLAATPSGWQKMPFTVLRAILGERKVRSSRIRFKDLGSHIFFEGWGYGHGVGFCQEGARAQALRGRDYKRILKFYFPEADLAPLDR